MNRYPVYNKKDIILKALGKCAIIDLSLFRSGNMKAHICNTKRIFSGFRALESMKKLYIDMDTEIKNKIALNNVEPICTNGCYECCYEYFTVSKIEYFVIKHFLLSNKINIDHLIKESIIIVEEFKKLYPEKFEVLNVSSQINIVKAYEDNDIREFAKCPFLINGSCSVYEVRPIICRLYGTSYTYPSCEKILNKCRNPYNGQTIESKVLKHMIDLPIMTEYSPGIDHDFYGNNFQKPYPLFWWIAHDKQYQDEYNQYTK